MDGWVYDIEVTTCICYLKQYGICVLSLLMVKELRKSIHSNNLLKNHRRSNGVD